MSFSGKTTKCPTNTLSVNAIYPASTRIQVPSLSYYHDKKKKEREKKTETFVVTTQILHVLTFYILIKLYNQINTNI